MRYSYISIMFLFCFFNVFSVGGDKKKSPLKVDFNEDFFGVNNNDEKHRKIFLANETKNIIENFYKNSDESKEIPKNLYQTNGDSQKDEASIDEHKINQCIHYRSKSLPEEYYEQILRRLRRDNRLKSNEQNQLIYLKSLYEQGPQEEGFCSRCQKNLVASVGFLMHFSQEAAQALKKIKKSLLDAKEREDMILNDCVLEKLETDDLEEKYRVLSERVDKSKEMIQNQEICITFLSSELEKERQRREGLEKDFNTFKLCVNNQFGKLSPVFKAMQLNQKKMPDCLIPKKIIKKTPKE